MYRLKWVDLTPVVRRQAMSGLRKAAESILTSAEPKVPFEYGDLQRSGATSLNPTKLEAYVFYDTPYAVRLHEHPEFRFRNGRQGKWLENTLNERRAEVQRYLAEEMRKAFNG